MQRHNKAALIIVLAVVAAGSIYLWARGSHDRVYDGLLQVGFEKSDFYPDANCAASPYWYGGSAKDSENLRVRWREMGSPPALRVKFSGGLDQPRALRPPEQILARDSLHYDFRSYSERSVPEVSES